MGEHGPVPKRSEERRRNNKPETPLDKVDAVGPVAIPKAPPTWHPVAKIIYNSLRSSAQSQFCEDTDWAEMYLLAESLSRDLKIDQPLKGASLAAYLKGLAALGFTEGDRRRMGIEIDRKPKKPALASVSVMDEYRESLGG